MSDSQRTAAPARKNSRAQISALLTNSADWELPPGLLERQSARELERAVMELRRSGFNESEIRARENQVRQNSAVSTAKKPTASTFPSTSRTASSLSSRKSPKKRATTPTKFGRNSARFAADSK